jgi:hypothetical protein
MAITMANGRAMLIPTDENFQLRPDLIEQAISERTRAVVTVSPNNPTAPSTVRARCEKSTRSVSVMASTISVMKRMSISRMIPRDTSHRVRLLDRRTIRSPFTHFRKRSEWPAGDWATWLCPCTFLTRLTRFRTPSSSVHL